MRETEVGLDGWCEDDLGQQRNDGGGCPSMSERLFPSISRTVVKSDYSLTITQHTPLSPYTRHLLLDFQ